MPLTLGVALTVIGSDGASGQPDRPLCVPVVKVDYRCSNQPVGTASRRRPVGVQHVD